MKILSMLNEEGVCMDSDGRYIATLEQLTRLLHRARKSATLATGTGARDAYIWMIANDSDQVTAAAQMGISQAALSQHIKRHKLPCPDKRLKAPPVA